MVLAGAGTGKTITIVGRIKYLKSIGIGAEEILCISFTNESVNDIKNKIKKETDLDVDVKTFHKLAIDILSKINSNYKLCDNNLLSYVITEYLEVIIKNDKDMLYALIKYFNMFTFKFNLIKKYDNIDKNKIKALGKLIEKFIRLMKTQGYDIDFFNGIYNSKIKHKNYYLIKLILVIYQLYENELSSSMLLDFDDLIIKASNKNVLSKIQFKYKYIFVDEYQDSSRIRFNLLKNIVDKQDAFFFAVGDDFQSIYKFSGCDLSIMLDFNKHFPDGKIYKISNTYRNSEELLNLSTKFIMKNKKQIYKKLKSSKHLAEPIKIIQ